MSLSAPLGLVVALVVIPLLVQPRNPVDPAEFHGILSWMWRFNQIYCSAVHRLKTGRAPLPGIGPAILIANHTCNIDHFLLQAGTRRKLGFMIAKEYYDFPLFNPICRMIGCIPVNRDGKDLAAIRAALRVLEQGGVVPMFPEGTIIPKSGEEIGQGKHGVAFLAIRAKVRVIPAYIRGTPRSIKFLRSLFTPSRAEVIYGPAIEPSEFVHPGDSTSERAFLTATTDRFMAAIRSIRDANPPARR